ncbi:hypothetical protein ACIPY2_21435 [Paenarthrobacter sp. NPDC089675]|uniref:hypothetical protein n=1 Tax=Paenarthrobacter sp. NPDC089675 TaxID=3364376 RepID=UPI003811B5EC
MIITRVIQTAARVGASVGKVIESAYTLDCADTAARRPADTQDWSWLPALSGVTVASAQAIRSHAQEPPNRL